MSCKIGAASISEDQINNNSNSRSKTNNAPWIIIIAVVAAVVVLAATAVAVDHNNIWITTFEEVMIATTMKATIKTITEGMAEIMVEMVEVTAAGLLATIITVHFELYIACKSFLLDHTSFIWFVRLLIENRILIVFVWFELDCRHFTIFKSTEMPFVVNSFVVVICFALSSETAMVR